MILPFVLFRCAPWLERPFPGLVVSRLRIHQRATGQTILDPRGQRGVADGFGPRKRQLILLHGLARFPHLLQRESQVIARLDAVGVETRAFGAMPDRAVQIALSRSRAEARYKELGGPISPRLKPGAKRSRLKPGL